MSRYTPPLMKLANSRWLSGRNAAGTADQNILRLNGQDYIELGQPLVGLEDRGGQVHNAKAYGAVGDGAAHPLSENYATLAAAQAVYPRATALTEQLDRHAIQRAIDVAGSWGTVLVPQGRYRIDATLLIGDGSASAISTIQGVKLLGAGVGFTHNEGTPGGATVLEWWGAAGGTMLTVNGPIAGIELDGLHVEGSPAGAPNRLGSAFDLRHIAKSLIQRLAVTNWDGTAYIFDAYSSVGTLAIGANNNHVQQLFAGGAAGANARGMLIGQAALGTSPFLDVAGCLFQNISLDVASGGANAIGVELRFCDNNTFVHVYATGGATGGGLRITPPTGSTDWPGGNSFYRCAFAPATTGTRPTTGGANTFWDYITGDGAAWPGTTANAVGTTQQGILYYGQPPRYQDLDARRVLWSNTDKQVASDIGSFSIFDLGDRRLRFSKASGDAGASANYIFEFGTVGGVDAISPYYNAVFLRGHTVTEVGAERYPAFAMFARSAVTADPTDYEAMLALAELGTLQGRVGVSAPTVTGSRVRFGFGSGSITTEALRVEKDATSAVTVIGGGTGLRQHLSATASLDFPSIAAGAAADLAITVTGAAVGDGVTLGPPVALEAGLVIAYWGVTAANTVTIRLRNETAAAIDPVAATWRAGVWKY